MVHLVGGRILRDSDLFGADMVTVCARCGSRATLGRDVILDSSNSYFVECQRRSKCSVPFPDLPTGWEWQKVQGYLYVAVSPGVLVRQQADREAAAAEAAATLQAVDENAEARRQAAEAQKAFYTRGKGARSRQRTAQALVDLFAAIKSWCESVARSQLITRQELICAGWSAAEIDRLLGEPDEIECWRKHGYGSGERHLYERTRVAAADRLRGTRIRLHTLHGPCVLFVGNDETVAIEPLPSGEPIEVIGNVADAIVAVVKARPKPVQVWWKRKLIEILETEALALPPGSGIRIENAMPLPSCLGVVKATREATLLPDEDTERNQ